MSPATNMQIHCCVSAQGVDANGAGNRNVFAQSKRFFHGTGRGRRNLADQHGTGVSGNNLGLVLFFGQGNVTVLKRPYFITDVREPVCTDWLVLF